MGLVLAFISAVVYGCADFCGGKATQRSSAYTVTVSSQLAGFVLVLAAVGFVPSQGPTVRAIGVGALAGLAGGIGILFLYHALANATMSIVSPVTAVVASVLPVIAGLLAGERPHSLALTGIGCSILAIVLVSVSHRGNEHEQAIGRTLVWSFSSGLGFAFFFILLARAGHDVGLWPLVGARPVSIGLAAVVARARRQPYFVHGRLWRVTSLAGVLDMLANVTYLLAIRSALLAEVAPVASLYPASTVALAHVIDGERIRRIQMAGLVVAALALVLIART